MSFVYVLLLWTAPLVLTGAALAGVPGVESAQSPPELVIRWLSDPARANRVLVEIDGLPPETVRLLERTNWTVQRWQQLLAVYVQPEASTGLAGAVPMAGEYRVKSNAVQFLPAFPLEPGIWSRAFFMGDSMAVPQESLSTVFRPRVVPTTRPTTLVTQVYPSSDVLPENLLKFYLHFSGPMSRGHIYEYIHLRNASGKEVELPFLEINEELWDPTMTRLTLFLDPGRIKRGVRPLEEIGPSLEQGQRYTLVISRQWLDAAGNPLAADFEKTFLVQPPDREPIAPAQWTIEPPRPGTRVPLAVNFPKPLDRALALKCLRVSDAVGNLVPGAVELTRSECRWTLAPDHAWKAGIYHLSILATIEDLAGNNIGKPFDVDLFENVGRTVTNTLEKLTFRVW